MHLGWADGSSPSLGIAPLARGKGWRREAVLELPTDPTVLLVLAPDPSSVLRIRPINPHDLVSIPPRFQRISLTPASSTTVSVDAGSSAGSISSKRSQTLNFHYDRVLGPDEGQRDLYEAAASKLVDKFIQGFNVTILACVLSFLPRPDDQPCSGGDGCLPLAWSGTTEACR